jgi:hypothetical protein
LMPLGFGTIFMVIAAFLAVKCMKFQ